MNQNEARNRAATADGTEMMNRRMSQTWAGLAASSGQATAEYALVMLAAAGLAGMALAWAVGGDGVERLLNAVMDSIIAEVTR